MNLILKSIVLAIISTLVIGCGGASNSSKNEVKSQKVTFKEGSNSSEIQKIINREDIIKQTEKVCMKVLDSGFNIIVDECNTIKISEETGKRVFDDFGKTFTKSDDYQAIYIAKDNQGNEVGRSNWVSFTVDLFSELFEEITVNMGYISFQDYIYIESLKIFDSSEKTFFNTGKISFFEKEEIYLEKEYIADKNGNIETNLFVIEGLNIDKVCFEEENKRTCYLLPSEFSILGKEIDLYNLRKEVVKQVNLINKQNICDIRFDNFIPNRNMHLNFRPSQQFEISNCKEEVEVTIEADNFLEELEYNLEYFGYNGYAYQVSSDIAYEEAFIGIDKNGVSGKVWYNVEYIPVNVEFEKEYSPKFNFIIRNMEGKILQEEKHFLTMTTYVEECDSKTGCEETEHEETEREEPKK